MGEVADPDHAGHQLGPLRPRPGRPRLARRGAGQVQAGVGEHPQHRGLAGVHELQPRAAVSQLAVAAAGLAPLPGELA